MTPDYALVIAAITALRRELARMTFKTSSGEHSLLEVHARSLTEMEAGINHHRALTDREARMNRPPRGYVQP